MKRWVLLAAMTAAMVPCAAAATNFSCSGHIQRLGASKTTLVVNIGQGAWPICRTDQASGGIGPEMCNLWFSMLMTARATGVQVQLYFNPAENGGVTGCSGLGSWISRTPYHLDVLDP